MTNPASIYIQFVRADLEHSKIEPMMAAFSQWTVAMRRKARLAAAAAILQGDATGGDEAKSDEQASLEVLAQRKETKKKQRAAAGSVLKRKRVTVRKNHPRSAPGVAYLNWSPTGKGYSVGDAPPDHQRVVWEVKQIYIHLHEIFGERDAATKMDYLTAPATSAGFLQKMKDKWDEGFPPCTSQPCAALKQALITFWTAKLPSTA